MTDTFRALVVREQPDGTFSRAVEGLPPDALPPGQVLVRVLFSSLNYKDALSATGTKGVTRRYPHIPGVDAAGIVERSDDPRFTAGQEVIVTGFELGSNHWGGFAGMIRVPAEWAVTLPRTLSLRESMVYGTAGFTAALGIHKLRHNGVMPGSGPLLVTGATGGVGCIAVAMLSKLGYTVAAVTGKPAKRDFLLGLGAAEVLGRDDLLDTSGRGLLAGRWAGGIDTVGGTMLHSLLRTTKNEGSVACCGNVVGHELQTSVYPFILRGVNLLGIGSAWTAMPLRTKLWELMSGEWKPPALDALAREVTLEALNPEITAILAGGQAGRVVIRTS
jgi:acrylyl-CoA reductase (NADPH)